MRLTVQVPRREPIKKYLQTQGRFRHLKDEDVAKMQKKVDAAATKFGFGPLRQ